MTDLVKLARERIDDSQRTHWEGCERDHRECLIQRMADEIERMRIEYAAQKAEIEHVRSLAYEAHDQMESWREEAERLGRENDELRAEIRKLTEV